MHPKAYAIVEKESGKILAVHMTRAAARAHSVVGLHSIIPVEIRQLKK